MRRINDLGGGQWMLASKSVWKRSYGVGKGEHKIRRAANKTCKPVKLCAEFLRAMSQEGDLVLDPMAGTGGVLLGAQAEGRRAIGAELDPKQVTAYQLACEKMSTLFKIYDKDVLRPGDFFQLFPEPKEPYADLVLTDPPWYDLDRRQKSSRYWKGKGSKKRPMQPYTHVPEFKSVSDWAEYIFLMAERIRWILKKGRYFAFFIEDAYIDKEYIFLSEIAKNAVQSVGFIPQGEWIWYNEARRACLFGYPSRMITSRVHTKILFFTNGPMEE